ncbi:hypothetical protein BHE74_00038644 [Ensete ventricosum]|nr:hypothetical protein BHE74_00038644 [Ensete ventricosum]
MGGDALHSDEDEKQESSSSSSKNEKLFTVDQTHSVDSKRLQLEEDTLGASLTGASTSKSSMEWRSSTIFRDSETECPFSSSSRRSSSNWETYTLFRKYDEEMMFFDRISAQKLTETELFRSMKVQPSSISQRTAHIFTTHKNRGSRDPYQELEGAYVTQICLAWEALNWNYTNFRRRIAKGSDGESSSCTAWMAQQFQQFQVLLQRFIENEPYEHGRRPQNKTRLKDLWKRRRCLTKKRREREEEMEILMGLIDMKIVSRVLRMPEISQEQLRWCEEKMSKVKVWDGKIQRDSSPLFFFPVH